jgi:hypothetical protein
MASSRSKNSLFGAGSQPTEDSPVAAHCPQRWHGVAGLCVLGGVGHAPIIFPAVLRVAVPYHPSFYLPLALLHLSLLVKRNLAGRPSTTTRKRAAV